MGKMTRPSISLLFVSLIIALLLVGGFALLTRRECSEAESTSARNFPIEALLIDAEAFPDRWKQDPSTPSRPASAPLDGKSSIERSEVFFYIRNGVAFEEAERFQCTQQAADEFQSWKDREFAERKYSYGWTPPSELPYQSPIADQYYLACGNESGIQMCRAIGQYQEYLVLFNTHMAPSIMTYADLERILRAIDDRMTTYLSKSTP